MAYIQGQPKGKVSIIIPYKDMNDMVNRCISSCFRLENTAEIIPIPDEVCSGFPSKKRNLGLSLASGAYIAFIDSDAYPSHDWLSKGIYRLNTTDCVAVCGPGVLPPDSTFLEKCADNVLRILPYSYRVIPKKMRSVAEFPTFNLIIKAEYAKKVKFRNYLTGEDSLYCRELTKYGRIIYDPEVKVYHYRRPLFRKFWKQIATYGKHRGYLIGLTLCGLLSTMFVYGTNFIKGIYASIIRSKSL